MTELETIQHAKNYLDKLAQGINPLTNEPIPENELLNNVRISRCLFCTSDILRQVLENGGVTPRAPREKKLPFHIDYETLTKFSYSDTPIAITQITERINDLVDTSNMKKISYTLIRNWLVDSGMLKEVVLSDEKTVKRPTIQGEQLGISVEHRVGQYGKEYDVVVYGRSAQEFIIDNLMSILDH